MVEKYRAAKILGAGLGAFTLGMALGEICPDPTDYLHFAYFQPWLANPINMANRALWSFVNIFDWYFLSFIWFFLLALIAIYWKVEWEKRLVVIGALLAGGIVAGLFIKFMFTGAMI